MQTLTLDQKKLRRQKLDAQMRQLWIALAETDPRELSDQDASVFAAITNHSAIQNYIPSKEKIK